jgi:hypothetical protein
MGMFPERIVQIAERSSGVYFADAPPQDPVSRNEMIKFDTTWMIEIFALLYYHRIGIFGCAVMLSAATYPYIPLEFQSSLNPTLHCLQLGSKDVEKQHGYSQASN